MWQINHGICVKAFWGVIFSSSNPPDVVRLGDVQLKLTSDDHYAQQIKVKQVITHPDRKQNERYNDLALVELQENVKYVVWLICYGNRNP